MVQKIRRFLDKYKNSKMLWVIKLTATAAVVYLVNNSLAHSSVAGIMKQVTVVPVLVAILLAAGGFYVQAVRWRLILARMNIPVTVADAVQTMLWGSLLAFVTPGRSGELLRGISLPAARKRDTVYAVIIEKCCAGAVTLVAGLACALLAVYRSGYAADTQRRVILFSAVLLLAYGAAIIAMYTVPRLKAALRIMRLFNIGSLTVIGGYSVLIHAMLLAESALLLAMFGSADIGADIFAAGQAYAFMMFFPIFIANMGIREYSFGIFLGYLVPALTTGTAVAFGASIGILILNIILPALLGLGVWLLRKTGYGTTVTKTRAQL